MHIWMDEMTSVACKVALIVSVLGSTLFASAAMADNGPVTGKNLLEWCEITVEADSVSVDLMEFGRCGGYVLGVADAYETATNAKGECAFEIDRGESVHKLIAVSLKALREHPDALDQPADHLITSVLAKAYHCKKSN